MLHIRWMIRRDLPELIAMEKADAEAVGREPWTEEDFLREIKDRNVVGQTAEEGDALRGALIYQLFKKRINILYMVADSPEVIDAMLLKMQKKLSAERRVSLIYYCRERDLTKQLCLRKHKFFAEDTLRNQFIDTGEDAYKFVYDLMPKDEASEASIDNPTAMV